MPRIVQFTHPGQEHGPDRTNPLQKSWNTGPHGRKFMRCVGDHVDASNRLVCNKPLLFWGEWEPPSDVKQLSNGTEKLNPKWLHEPYVPAEIPSDSSSSCSPTKISCQSGCGKGKSLQNTDPFVFEDAFRYFVCKQAKKGREDKEPFKQATGMSELDKGSMILFGSTSGKKGQEFFQLDTVFIVADWIEYDPSNLKPLLSSPKVSRFYDQLVISKVFPQPASHSINLRLYFGATVENPSEGMYSFSPSRVCEAEPRGFPRVRLQNMDFLTNNLNSAPKFTPKGDRTKIKRAWLDIRQESRKQGCVEGVRFSVEKEHQRSVSSPHDF